MARLQMSGVYCVHSDSYDDDIWIKLSDGTIRTVQIKGATKPYVRGRRTVYHFLVRPTSADLFAFVAMDVGLILLKPTKDVTASTKRIDAHDFTQESQDASIEKTLSEMRKQS
jgi:hypothetical protein